MTTNPLTRLCEGSGSSQRSSTSFSSTRTTWRPEGGNRSGNSGNLTCLIHTLHNYRVVFATQRMSYRVWGGDTRQADGSWMQFGVTHTDLSHSLCLCVLFCKHSCSCLSCHSCRGHGFHTVAVHTGSPLGGDTDRQLVQHGSSHD